MGEDREQLTDEELAFRRHARFGELPRHVAPEELVETAQIDHAREEPVEPQVRREWG